MKKKILIIAAHPDDDILGCGGFISKFKKETIKVVFLAEGTSCRYDNLKKNIQAINKEIKRREAMSLRALRFLKVKKFSYHYNPCGRLDTVPIINLNKIIEKEVFNFRPDIILTHSENDCNNDHRIIFRSVMMATRPNLKYTVPVIMSFEVLSSSEWNFTKYFDPNYFVKLELKNIKEKWRALKFFTSETHKKLLPRSYQGVFNLAKQRGLQVGVEFAEAFKIIRSIKK